MDKLKSNGLIFCGVSSICYNMESVEWLLMLTLYGGLHERASGAVINDKCLTFCVWREKDTRKLHVGGLL